MWHRAFELHNSERMIGRLEFATMGGSRATAQVDAQIWSFKRTGFFKTQTTARTETSEENLVTYEPNWRATGGELRFADGTPMKLAQTNFWGTAWDLRTATGDLVLTFHNEGALRSGAHVQVAEVVPGTPSLELLVCFVWYIMVLHMQDAVIVST
jgi:hypothetical protein